eukprot:4797347-Pleurochrysis_carterae.AAC.1
MHAKCQISDAWQIHGLRQKRMREMRSTICLQIVDALRVCVELRGRHEARECFGWTKGPRFCRTQQELLLAEPCEIMQR